MQKMYTNGILIGPYIEIKPAKTHSTKLINFKFFFSS